MKTTDLKQLKEETKEQGINLRENNLYWLKALQREYNLTEAEMGFLLVDITERG